MLHNPAPVTFSPGRRELTHGEKRKGELSNRQVRKGWRRKEDELLVPIDHRGVRAQVAFLHTPSATVLPFTPPSHQTYARSPAGRTGLVATLRGPLQGAEGSKGVCGTTVPSASSAAGVGQDTVRAPQMGRPIP